MNYVELRSFDNYIYANILLLRMKSEGVDCYLKDENVVTIDPLLSPAVGGMKLMVSDADLSRANALLEEIELEYLKTLPCPSCGKSTIQRILRPPQNKGLFHRLVNVLVNGSPDENEIFYRCINCGYKSEALPAPGENDF